MEKVLHLGTSASEYKHTVQVKLPFIYFGNQVIDWLVNEIGIENWFLESKGWMSKMTMCFRNRHHMLVFVMLVDDFVL